MQFRLGKKLQSHHIKRKVSCATMHQTPLTVDSDEHIRYDQKG